MMIDQELHDGLHRLLLKTVNLLKSKIVDEEEDFTIVYLTYGEEVTELKEFKECLSLLTKKVGPKVIFGVNMYSHLEISEAKADDDIFLNLYLCLMNRFLTIYLERLKNVKFDEALFDELYAGFEEAILKGVDRYRLIALLENFSMEQDELNLGEVTIRKITQEERGLLKVSPFGYDKRFPRPPLQYAVERSCKIKYDEYYEYYKSSNEIFNRLITALRLFKTGNCGYTRVVSDPSLWHLHPPSWLAMELEIVPYSLPTPVYFGEKRYLLEENEFKAFKDFWSKFERIRAKSSLRIVLSRFNTTYTRPLPEDILINSMIAFEAMLLPGIKEELGYRMALRCAHFLADNFEERKEVFNALKAAYNIRSGIVHGSSEKSIKKDLPEEVRTLNEFGEKIRDYLRRAILKLIEELAVGKKLETIMNKINDKILDCF